MSRESRNWYNHHCDEVVQILIVKQEETKDSMRQKRKRKSNGDANKAVSELDHKEVKASKASSKKVSFA